MTIKLLRILLISFFFITGCTGGYGKISKPMDNENKITIQELKENWNQYFVYSGTRDGIRPSALMFDPKKNGTKLGGDSWTKIDDGETFLKTLNTIETIARSSQIGVIRGQDDKIFGFMYYPKKLHVIVKIVDENTLYVMPLPPPVSTR